MRGPVILITFGAEGRTLLSCTMFFCCRDIHGAKAVFLDSLYKNIKTTYLPRDPSRSLFLHLSPFEGYGSDSITRGENHVQQPGLDLPAPYPSLFPKLPFWNFSLSLDLNLLCAELPLPIPPPQR
jgi:hypothetical protein